MTKPERVNCQTKLLQKLETVLEKQEDSKKKCKEKRYLFTILAQSRKLTLKFDISSKTPQTNQNLSKYQGRGNEWEMEKEGGRLGGRKREREGGIIMWDAEKEKERNRDEEEREKGREWEWGRYGERGR